jgi:cell division protein FtsN
VTRSTVRDYKKARRHGLEVARWRDFGAGLLVGAVLVAAALAMAHRPEREHAPDRPRPDPHRVASTEAAAAESSSAERYDFYQMLPHFEVVVPEKERDVRRDIPTAKIERPGVYVLQAGSYREEAEADRVAKQLSLEGIEAKVQRVAVDNDVWHRVRVGPISDLGELNRVRKQLAAADLDALVIRVGD